MKGPRILLALLLGLLLVGWWALVGDRDADLERGLEESDVALDAFEEELRALDALYQPLVRQGHMLSLRSQHERLRSGLARLRARRLELQGDSSIERRARLPAFRQLVQESDELLAETRSLRGRVQARQEFREVSSPLLERARSFRDRFAELDPPTDALRTRRDALGASFADLEQGARTTDRILADNLSQGTTLGHSNLTGLKRLIEQQEALAQELGLAPPTAPTGAAPPTDTAPGGG